MQKDMSYNSNKTIIVLYKIFSASRIQMFCVSTLIKFNKNNEDKGR